MKTWILTILAAVVFSQFSMAQTTTSETSFTGMRRGVATVMLAGLGGAVLGLSTLSFYGNPQDHIGNIWTGLALGAAGGAVYAFSQSQPKDTLALDPVPKFNQMRIARQSPLLFQYRFEF